MAKSEEPSILIAEDDPNDAFLLRRAFREAGVAHRFVLAHDGAEAIDYLSDGAAASRWCLVVTDLKMPRVNGFELLAWIRAQPHLQHLPVLVFSSSPQESDLQRTRHMGASDYFVKPSGFLELVALAKRFHHSWIAPYCNEKSEAR